MTIHVRESAWPNSSAVISIILPLTSRALVPSARVCFHGIESAEGTLAARRMFPELTLSEGQLSLVSLCERSFETRDRADQSDIQNREKSR